MLYRVPETRAVQSAAVGVGLNPFLTYEDRLLWAQYADSMGVDAVTRAALVTTVDDALRSVGGVGFEITPCSRANDLSTALGFSAHGGVWLKDETNNVSGSHKGRFLMSILLVLLAEEHAGRRDAAARQPLAIASCGNAALAAATLARAVNWPLHVFVPVWGNPAVVDRITALGALVTRCPRLSSDPPGDPCIFRFREAVANGAIPFAVQGTENAYCNDGGRTIGWEIADAEVVFDRVFVAARGAD